MSNHKLLNPITLFGPLNLELNLGVKVAPRMIGDSTMARNLGHHYGGSLLKQLRVLQHLGYSSNIVSYLGNDEIAEKIISFIKTENISSSIQKIPGMQTDIVCNFFNQYSNSSFCTGIKNLAFWNMRLKTIALANPSVIYIHPAVPSKIQIDIIKKYNKTSKIILQPPLDKNYEVFNAGTNLIVVLNEFSAFEFFLMTNKPFFSGVPPLRLPIFEKHLVVAEVHKKLFILDPEKKPLFTNFSKFTMKNDAVNDYFIAGLLAATCAKQGFRTSLLWSLVTSIKNAQQQNYSVMELSNESSKFTWQDVVE